MSPVLERAITAIAAIPKPEQPTSFKFLDLENYTPPDDDYFEYDRALNVMRVYWGGYDYEVDLARIESPAHLCEWVVHLGVKAWPLNSSTRLACFIRKVAAIKKMGLHT